MAIDTTFTSGNPYFDDWSSSGNQSKNYLKILFQPGRSVQVRELNQMQSAIQAQIDLFGQNIFVDGTAVLDGQINVDKNVQWVDVQLTANASNAAADTSRPLIGKTLYSGSNLASADVSGTIVDYELKADDEYRFYIRYTSATTSFAGGSPSRKQQDVKIAENVGSYLTANDAVGSGTDVVTVGYALKIASGKGVYFVKGYFVEAPAQIKYINVNQTSGPRLDINDSKVGFTITEDAKTAVNDSSLYDNATGSTNESAPGADRYTIGLTLVLITDDTNIDRTKNVVATTANNIVDVVSLNNTEVVNPVQTKYNVLGERLAKRTFEESGDYTLQPFQLDLREDFDNGFNRGRSTSGDAAKFTATLEPSVAYVKGARVEILKKQEIIVDKARDTHLHQNLAVQARQGSFITGNTITHLPKTDNTESYTLKTASGGTTIGTCTVRGLEFTGRLYKLYIDNLVLEPGKVLSQARHIEGDADNDGSATFVMSTPTTEAGFFLFDVQENNLIFQLPEIVIKTLEDAAATSNIIKIPQRETKQNQTPQSSNSLQIQLSSGEAFYHDNPNEYIVTKESDGSLVTVTGVTLSTTTTTLDTVTLALSGIGTNAVDVTYSKRKTGTKRSKTKDEATETKTSATYAPGDTIALANDDIINLVEIKDSSSGSVDLSDTFVLDDGQTPTAYTNGKLICKKAYTGTVYVKYKHFNHGSGDFFSVDSYPIADTSSATAIERIEAAFAFGNHLLDCLDFRGSSTSLDPNGIIEIGSITNYLARHDRIAINSNGKFLYIKGDTDANAPKKIPDDAMRLYDLNVPAYTNSVRDIEIGYVDNKRYTMRDIGRIERRVKNLEYYSSLSLLEQATKEKQIFDSAGDRFKNGILVDEFKGHGTGDPTDPGYLCAIEPETGTLRPSFTATNIGIYNTDNTAADNSPSGSTPIGAEDLIRLPATSIETLIDQPFASVAISVNPFDVASWVGEVKLSPPTDEWRDTNRRPDVIISQDGNAEAIQQIMNETLASIGTRWNDWNTTWSGVTNVQNLGWKNFSGAQQVFGKHAKHTRNCRCGHRNTLTVPSFGGGTITATDQRRARIHIEARTTTTEQIREGIQQFAETETLTQSLGDRVVDVSFVPFIRSRKVYFNATGLKPNTTVYPYFDGVLISDYAKEATFVEFRDDTARTDHTDDTPGNITSGALVTDDAGKVSGYFIVPNNKGLRFRTGERDFLLSDEAGGNLSNATTFAKATYTARGMVQTVEEQVLSTRQVKISERQVTDSRTLTSTEVAATKVKHVDPVAQTFLVDPDIHPGGVFLKDIDLFFQAKHGSLPVRAMIVTTENGIPTQKIIPFTEVEKEPADVNVSADASAATTFVFESPVHLKSGVEYAIVVMSNSPDYMIWHSEVGGTDVGAGGKRITKNPYTGVALKSANASTWTPDQNKDFKFAMRYMKFPTSAKNVGDSSNDTGYGDFVSILPATVSATNPLLIDTICLNAETVQLPETSVTFKLKVNDGSTTRTYTIEPGANFDLSRTVAVTSASQLELVVVLDTDNDELTPTVDVTRLSLLTFHNQANNLSTNELNANHGDATARYITKLVGLQNAASRIDCYVDIRRPTSTTDVKAYARFGYDQTFKELQTETIPVSNVFEEVHFRTSEADDSPSSAGRTFDAFQIKFVMLSNGDDDSPKAANTAYIPELRNFRAIATA